MIIGEHKMIPMYTYGDPKELNAVRTIYKLNIINKKIKNSLGCIRIEIVGNADKAESRLSKWLDINYPPIKYPRNQYYVEGKENKIL